MQGRPAPAWAAGLAALATLIVLSGCGSSGSPSTSAAATSSPAGATRNVEAIDQARIKAASCIRAQGINIPDFGQGRGQVLQVLRIVAGYPEVKVQAAMRACASEIHQAFPNATALTPQQRAQRLREGSLFAQCMRAHGINFPDPAGAASNPAAYLNALSSVDLSSPAYKAAAAPCRAQVLKPAGG
jgi:hypothetical protein